MQPKTMSRQTFSDHRTKINFQKRWISFEEFDERNFILASILKFGYLPKAKFFVS